ncbi:MAG: AAA family ATPase [Taibaiella sp.]|nr:AAA family ATPase [Taibaiella sp.]
MEKISIRNLGPITEADITFGDLTILVGPQASGKSILLQMATLVEDNKWINDQLFVRGYAWHDIKSLVGVYFGESTLQLWQGNTQVSVNGEFFNTDYLIKSINEVTESARNTFYVPAHRILTIQNGWPKPFDDFRFEPFILSSYSETIRLLMEGLHQKMYGNHTMQDLVYNSIYDNGKVEVEVSNGRKKFVLNLGDNYIPFQQWSTGQKEFMPLLLGFNLLTNAQFSAGMAIKTVIIEEPEMGLHPAAIKQVIVSLLKLVQKGYKIIVSTHSPVFLEFAWAFQFLQEGKVKDEVLYELFNMPHNEQTENVFKGILQKSVRTYYFDKQEKGVFVKDISSLDASSDDPAIAEWGGLSTFGSRAAEIVAKNIPL